MRRFVPRPAPGESPYVIAHRGISGKAPENTLASFLRAAAVPGIDMVELDVHVSRDGIPVVVHDRTLQRTTTGNGTVWNYTLAELQTLDAGSWFHRSFRDERIPTLKTVLASVGSSVWVNIEIKSHLFHREQGGVVEQAVLAAVDEADMRGRVLYSSFSHHRVSGLKHLDPGAVVGVLYNLYRDIGRKPSSLARASMADVFVCARHELRRSMVEDAHRHGIAVYVYTLNSVGDVNRMMDLGVDGIMSDNADEIVDIVRHARQAARQS